MIYNSTFGDIDVPEEALHTWMFTRFKQYGNATALVDGVTGEEYSYACLVRRAQRVACGLQRHGLRPGDVLSLYSENSVQCMFMYWGVLAAGGTISTVNPHYTHYEVVDTLKLSGSRFVYCAPHLVNTLTHIHAQTSLQTIISTHFLPDDPAASVYSTVLYSALYSDRGALRPVPVRPREDVAVILYSSGTTGLPKAVMLTHYNVLANRLQMLKVQSHEATSTSPAPQPVVIVVMPFYHAYGLISISTAALSRGAKLVILPRFTPTSFLECVQKYKVTLVQLVPPIAAFLATTPLLQQYDVSSIQRIVCSSASLAPHIEVTLRELLHVPNIRQTYGLTEASPTVTQHHPLSPGEAGCSGALLPGTQAKIMCLDTGLAVGAYERGEVYLRGPQIMKGYLHNTQATQRAFSRDGFYKTGDVGYFDSDSNLYIVDRIKEFIKVKGFQVAPAELEAVLLTHPCVCDVGVVGVTDARAGELMW